MIQNSKQIVFKNYKLLTKNEHKALLEIRNLEHIRKVSHNDKIISLKEHLIWVENLDDSRQYFAIVYNNEIIGGIHLIKNENYKWGMFFDNKTAPFLSMMAVYSFIKYLKKLKIEEVYALMKKDNKEAYKMNRFFGIEIVDFDEEFYQTYLEPVKWTPPIFFEKKNIDYKIIN